jgi:hypothetical protein
MLSATIYAPCNEWKQITRERDKEIMGALEMAGYIQFQESQQTYGNRMVCTISLTDEGNKMAQLHNWSLINGIWNIKNTYKQELAEITGSIGGETNHANAEFTWKWGRTELGEKLKLSPPTHTLNGRATFQRYDDGWRLAGVSTM